MNSHTKTRLLKGSVVISGSLVTALGVLVIIGWHTHSDALLHVRPNFVTMVYNTALGFILCGTGIIAIALNRPRWATLGGVLASLTGLLTLIEYQFGVDLGIDQLLMKPYTSVANAYAGRMAVSTAAFFFAAGAAISLLGASRRFRYRALIVGVLGAAATVQGIVAFGGYLTGVASVYVWGDVARMAIHTSFGAALAGASLLMLAWRDQGPRQRSKDSYWLPILVGLGVVTIALCMWQALIVQQRGQSERLLETQAANLRSEMAGHMQIRMQELHRMAERWEQNGKPSKEVWEGNARLNLKDFTGLVALYWTDVSHQELWTAELPDNQFSLDLDTVSDREHSIAQSLSDQDLARIMPAVDLGQKGKAFNIYVPVFERGQLSGFIIGVQRVQELVDEATAHVSLGREYAIAVFDGKTQIYGDAIGDQRSQQTKQKTEVEFPGTTWQIWVWPKASTVSEFGSNVPTATLIVGLLAALLLSGSVRLAQNARRNARRIGEANLGLQEQIAERRRTEAELGDLSTLMRTILDSANYTIISTDLDSTILTFNKAAERLLGYSAEEVIGKQTPVIFHDPQEVAQRAALMSAELGRKIEPGMEVFRARSRTGGKDENEWSYVRKDGSRFPALVSVTALHNQDGQVAGYLGIGSDITERKQAEADIRGLQEFQAAILSGVQHGIQGIDTAGRIAFENPIAAAMLGWDLNELIGKPAHATMHHHHADGSSYPAEDCNIYATLHDGQPRHILDEVFWRQDGTSFPVAYTVAPMHSASGEVTGTVVVFDDISESKRAEETLRDSEERYRDLFENANDIIYTHDLQGNYTSVNKACEKILGYASEEALRMNIAQLVAPERLEEARQRLAQKTRERAPSSFEMEIIAKDGHRAVLEVNSRLTYQDGEPSGVQGMARDITERKQIERALQESETRYRLLVETLPAIIYHTEANPPYSPLYVSANVLSLGYSVDEWYGIPDLWINSLHPDDREWVLQETELAMGAGVETEYEYRVIAKDGSVIWLHDRGHFATDSSGKRTWQGVMLDITERKRAEAERQAITEIVQGVITTSNLDELFSLAHQAISTLLSAENCFIALYDKTSDLLNIPFCKDEFDPIAPPQKLGRGLTAFVLRSGRPMLLTPELIQELVSKGEIELVGTLPAAWLGVPLRTSTDIIGVLVVQHYEDKDAYSQQDIELLASVADQLGLAIERKQIEIKLKTNEIQLTEAQHIANLGSWEWDVLTNKVRWSDELFSIFGLQPQESGATFETFLTFVHPDDRKIAESAIAQAFEDKVFPQYEYRITRPNGTLRVLQANGQVSDDETGRIIKMVGTVLDITERKRAETEREVISEVIQSVNLTANLDELLTLIHESLGKVVYAENCFVSLYDKETGLFDRCFYVDQCTPNAPPQQLRRSCSAYVYRTGRPLLMNDAKFQQLLAQGDVELVGAPSPSWLGVPLKTTSETLGVLVVQHYEQDNAYTERDAEFLSTVGAQIAVAIERKRADEALKESDRRFRDLFYDAPVGYHELDTEGRITCVNSTELLMVGYSSEEMIGHHVWEFIEEAGVAHAAFLERLVGKAPPGTVERSFRRKDGTLMEVQLDDRMLHDPSGRIMGVRATMLDITERKRTEEAVKASEAKFKDLFDDAPVAYHELDREGRITRVNRAELDMLGYTAEELVGRPIWDLVFEKVSHEAVKQKLTGTVPRQSYERTFIRKDGTLVPVMVEDRLIYDAEGKVTGIRTTLHDITRQKQMEEDLRQARDTAVESARLKSEFLANMSHEIRTPMNGVIGMTGLLLDTDLDEEQRDCAETIRGSGESLLTIINDILDFSKMEAGKLQFEKLDFLLNNVVEDTIELLAGRAHQKKIEFASLVCNDVPTALRGDPGRLRQVLTNLIGNAIKFTDHGEVVVRVEKESETDEDVVVRFMVSDTGIGISEAAQKPLFQAFTQADGSTTRKYGGTGLGLAISKQLVELMGGEIGVDSKSGQGSTFWFTARFDKQVAKAVLPQPQLMSLEKLRVLIVDDNATNRKILSHQLGSWGMIHQEADSGIHALELLRSAAAKGAPYDFAVLDLMMPGMDGFEVARTIKSDPSLAGIHLVMLTSFGERGHGATARDAGVAAYLTKPVRQSQLFDCLANVISAAAATPKRQVTSPQASPNLLTKHTLKEAKVSSNKLILLAEDNIVNQKVAIRQLQKLGYRCDAVANGREAIEALERIQYDLVLMDCQMPEMDGYEATAEIRRREAGSPRRTIIIAMTAHALTGDREKCITAGMDDYLSKPVKVDELAERLERWAASLSQSPETEQPRGLLASSSPTPVADVRELHPV